MMRASAQVLGVVLLVASLAGAQTASSGQAAVPGSRQGNVHGVVRDDTGAALPGVTVYLRAGDQTRMTVTGADGAYQMTGVPAGRVALRFTLLNFAVVTRDLVVASGGAARADAVGEDVVRADAVLRLALSADVVVTGQASFRNLAEVDDPAGNLVGIAGAASQGAVTAAQLARRPVLRAGDVLEAVPGLIVSQHSGEGKANQFYLRGFNLDHGTDFSTQVAGVPVNTPSGAHAHGYTDTNFLIPELVSGIQFKKGPYFADEGDFSAAGAANVNYATALTRPVVSFGAGGDGWRRTLAMASPRVGPGHLLAAAEVTAFDGPWVREDGFRKLNGVLRYSQGDARNGFSITGMGYWADWESTDQVPERAVQSGQISRFGFIDPSDQGHTERQSLAAELQRSAANVTTRGSAFVLRNRLTLFSNFTYFLDDPVDGDQFEQSEQRVTAGGRVSQRRLGRLFGRHTESALGGQVRHDWIDPVGLYRAVGGVRTTTTREDRVGQTLAGVFAQTEVQWLRALRTTVGLRADAYRFDVRSTLAANSGRGTDAIVSPKFSAVIGPWAGTEFYANAGFGYHSNDARGAVTRVDPSTGEAVTPVTPLVRARGAELGLRTVRVRGLQSTLSAWYLGLDSELLFVGDAGTTEAGRPSRRAGLEWTNYARLGPWLQADADVSWSRARFVDGDPAGSRVPGALDRVIGAGLSADRGSVSGNLRVRHFGPRPLVADASAMSRATTLWNVEGAVRLSRRARVVLQGFNLFNSKVADIDYFYRSRLPGEAADGVDDVHTHPALPRSLRLGLHVAF